MSIAGPDADSHYSHKVNDNDCQIDRFSSCQEHVHYPSILVGSVAARPSFCGRHRGQRYSSGFSCLSLNPHDQVAAIKPVVVAEAEVFTSPDCSAVDLQLGTGVAPLLDNKYRIDKGGLLRSSNLQLERRATIRMISLQNKGSLVPAVSFNLEASAGDPDLRGLEPRSGDR